MLHGMKRELYTDDGWVRGKVNTAEDGEGRRGKERRGEERRGERGQGWVLTGCMVGCLGWMRGCSGVIDCRHA